MSTTRTSRAHRTIGELFEGQKLKAEILKIAESHQGSEIEMRNAIVARMKQALQDGHAEAERLLKEEGSGRMCAMRLSALQDAIVTSAHEVATTCLYPVDNPSRSERMAVAAVGGYGRGMLAPGSDTDILFLLPYKQTAWGESVAEAMLYIFWDLGLKVGHATRSVDECVRQARADFTIRTSILEARFLVGERALFEDLEKRFDKDVVEGTAAEFVAAKMAEREERLRRAGQSRYLVEPNVKEGKGGLRDLHTLFWMAQYVYRVHSASQLVAKEVFTREEARLFRRCEDFLWSVRCNLHFLTGRAEERLSFDLQREMAQRLGYTEHPGQKDVERFMKHYFLVAKDVGDLTAIVSAALEARHDKPVPGLMGMVERFRGGPRKVLLKDSPDFIIDHARLNVADAQAFKRNPVNLIRIFHVADRRNLALHPDAVRLAARSLPLIDAELRENPEANRLFLEILTSKNAPETVLRRMNEAGVLGRFLPEFGKIVALMQFNMYHHYTVDEHLLRCIGNLSEIERKVHPDNVLANELMGTVKNRNLIYVALLLHDIAKGRPEDHSVAGARIARRIGPRFGLSAVETDTVAWLVEKHLVMSAVAQSRDLSDRKTIENFAAVVQSLERLKLLTVLTTADIRAVGPGTWNSWKAQLLRTLYYETEPVLTGGFSEVDRGKRVAAAQVQFRGALTDWPDKKVEAYIARHYPPYWLRVDLDTKIIHARFVDETEKAGNAIATHATISEERGITTLMVLAPDHPKVLSIIAGACAAAGANIVDAHISTTTDGLALDTIAIRRAFDRDEDEARRARKIQDSIEKALAGTVRLPEVMARKLPKVNRRTFTVEPEVAVNNAWSNRHTVVEVSGLDRPGLLFELTKTLSRLNLNIASAHVATFGERAVDVFYVTDLMGAKITAAARQSAIRRALVTVFEGPGDEEDAPRRAARG